MTTPARSEGGVHMSWALISAGSPAVAPAPDVAPWLMASRRSRLWVGTMPNPLRYLRYWRGLVRLRLGCCPACNSSPPYWTCNICRGSYEYGPLIDDSTRENWRDRWRVAAGGDHA